jgi:hypothetical protein
VHLRPRRLRLEVVALVLPVLIVAVALGVSVIAQHGSVAPVATTAAHRNVLSLPRVVSAKPTAPSPATQPPAPVAPVAVAPPPPAPPPPPAIPDNVAMAGCPPPPPPPPGPYVPPWHPDVLVPDSALPAPAPASGPDASLLAITGKGMWVWQYGRTESGNVAALVDRAVATGLRQIWVRVADSRDGFYGAGELAALVPAAHARGLAVIAWGFPYFYDPVADAQWTNAVLAWRAADGERVDGFSPDIETASEGVALSAQRVAVYLGMVRPARDGRPLVATVYPPTDHWLANYPYATMAPYVDAYAPMMYWECEDPGAAADQGVSRLATYKPVHVIGQAFGMGDVHGRIDQPSGAEMTRFMGIARRDGAVGASFWVWQLMNAEEWSTLSAYPWPGATPPPPPDPLPARPQARYWRN